VPHATYADTVYYIAMVDRFDRLHAAANNFHETQPARRIVTLDTVLVELLAYYSKRGERFRQLAVAMVDEVVNDRYVTLIHQDARLFFAGLDLYRARLDKGYSLTDCMSMVVCREQEISDVLTHDRHFEQEGFAPLL
jgi:predicted nucleic acid-binding protein